MKSFPEIPPPEGWTQAQADDSLDLGCDLAKSMQVVGRDNCGIVHIAAAARSVAETYPVEMAMLNNALRIVYDDMGVAIPDYVNVSCEQFARYVKQCSEVAKRDDMKGKQNGTT